MGIFDWFKPGNWAEDFFGAIGKFFSDFGDAIVGPLKDITLVAGWSMGIVVFFTTYHRRAIYEGAKQAGQYAVREAPLLLV